MTKLFGLCGRLILRLKMLYLVRVFSGKYYATDLAELISINAADSPLEKRAVLDIVAVAFNNASVIRHQILLLKKNLKDAYCYTVADNSTDASRQVELMEVCREHAVAYVRLPRLPLYCTTSKSHGMALNWVYRNYLKPRQADYFGFIDHDIFPVRPHSIVKYLAENPVYGYYQDREVGGEKLWYLWPGFSFFSRAAVKDSPLNFMPGSGSDTGGANWALYSRLEKKNLKFAEHEYSRLPGAAALSRDFCEYIGDWVHTFDASNWLGGNGAGLSQRQAAVDSLLEKYYSADKAANRGVR